MKKLLPALGLLLASAAQAQTGPQVKFADPLAPLPSLVDPLAAATNPTNPWVVSEQQRQNWDDYYLNQQNVQARKTAEDAYAHAHPQFDYGQSIRSEASVLPPAGRCTSKRSAASGPAIPGICALWMTKPPAPVPMP